MMESVGFLVFVLATVYVIWWSFRHDDKPRLAAIEKAAKIKRQAESFKHHRREEGRASDDE